MSTMSPTLTESIRLYEAVVRREFALKKAEVELSDAVSGLTDAEMPRYVELTEALRYRIEMTYDIRNKKITRS